jgi:hypothetical protein
MDTTTTPEQPSAIEVTVTVKLTGALANIDTAADLAAALDELLAARYAETYRGMNVKLDVPLMIPHDQPAAEQAARNLGIIP